MNSDELRMKELKSQWIKQVMRRPSVVTYFGTNPADFELLLEGWAANEMASDVLDEYHGCALDFALRNEAGEVVRDCHEMLTECPVMFDYCHRMIGFNEDRMMDVLVKWADDALEAATAPNALETVCRVMKKFHSRTNAPRTHHDSRDLIVWLFNKMDVKFDLYDRMEMESTNISVLEYYLRYGQRSPQFAYVMHREFEVSPNLARIRPGQDSGLVAWLKIANSDECIARDILFNAGVIFDEEDSDL